MALLELEEGKLAPSSRGPKKSRLSFVEDLILTGTGGLYPLTVFRIRAGAACLKRGGYRAAAGYLGDAEAFTGLVALLEDADPLVRAAAIRSLERVAPDASRALPQMVDLAQDPHTQIQRAASHLLNSGS